jgi:PAS domain S-box-containing protein
MSNSLLPEHRLKRNFISSLFIISVVIGISEALVMLLLDAMRQWGIVLTPIQGATLDTVLLACLSGPMLWWLALRPLLKQIESEQVHAAEQIRLNSELRTSQFNAILNTFTSAIITIDKTGIVQSFNKSAEQIFGYNVSEITGKNISCLMPPAIAAQHNGYLQRYLNTKKSNILGNRRELEGQRKNGDIFPALLRISQMEIDGELFFFGVMDDISETKTLQAQLVQAQKLEAIGQLASGVAHEINTPIQYIGDNLSALRDNFADMIEYQQALNNLADDTLKPQLDALSDKYDLAFILEDSPKAIQQAQEGVERVSEIVKAMKIFSHIEQSQTKQAINLHEALNSALTISRNSYKYIAQIETDFSSDVGAIECYANELNQVFLNLIINAAHAIEEKQAGMGLIRIVTRKLDDIVEILIQDNGAGIPSEIQEKVFNLFFSTKVVGKGTGQGLSLSHSIVVEKHRGKLFFESSVGVGTTFHIQLPINLEEQK